eukprot:IDg13752t1
MPTSSKMTDLNMNFQKEKAAIAADTLVDRTLGPEGWHHKKSFSLQILLTGNYPSSISTTGSCNTKNPVFISLT